MNPFLILIIACNVIYSYKGFTDLTFYRKNMYHIGSIRAGEQSRMISSAFLHADWAHLFFNMFTLYMFAPVIINELGNTSFLLIYIGSLVCGSLLTLFFHKNDYGYTAVGASGAVMGILYSAILLAPDMRVNFIPGYLFGIIYLVYSIYGMKSKSDNIGHTAHFGGAVGGFLITLTKVPSMLTENTQTVVLLTIPIVILFIMVKLGKL
jgi:membrane associated rhomboid family serine protease